MSQRSVSALARIVMATAVLSGIVSVARAQSILQFQGQYLAVTGQPVPGLTGGEVFGGTSTFETGVMDDAGRIFFRGRFTGGTATPQTERAYFYGSSAADLQMVLRSGDPDPSGLYPGVTLNSATGNGLGGSPRISANGTIFFGATLTGVGVTAATSSALYSGTPGNFQVVVRQGDVAAGTIGATYSTGFTGISTQNSGINDNGQVLFLSSLAGGDVVGTTNNQALFSGVAGAPQMVIRKGDFAPGGEVISSVMGNFVSQLNSQGQILFDVFYAVGSGAVPVTASDDRALYVYTPGFGVTEIARENGPSSIPGVVFRGTSTTPFSVSSCVFNNAGQALVLCDLSGAVTPGVDDRGIFILSTAGPTLALRKGDAAPGIAGATFNVMNNSSVFFNDNTQFAFEANVLGGGTTSSNDSGIWTGTIGNLQLIAREGDIAPGTGGGVFGETNSFPMMMNNSGQVLFNNTIVGGSFPGSAYFIWDPIIGLQPLVLQNESVEVTPGVFKSVGTTGGIQFTNGNARPLTFSGDGTISNRVNFIDGTSAIVKMRYGSLTGTPPAVSGTTGGTHTLYLNGGAAHAGEVYVVVGSITGTSPGTFAGSVFFPLNVDFYTQIMLGSLNVPPFFNTLGSLDASGRAVAAIQLPPNISNLAGIVLYHVFGTLDGFGVANFASEPATLTIAP